ncbi:hypothetical protein CO038_02690 [Candidatus Pacearchaeota archaeon CG_4_9_14_0_2_um_filter_39_13]|nr:ABC transporter permease [Candidatus Pacearchaeota archaeon]OIO44429.1 MAG: hypothetical protein AUJ64_00100 [Candidatus Pacearchaeota archaeon CG1_02_39_14]PJC44653.1 MAG: hypothetical protein CO038_02690 [Candidatus Pacearchaeota archaeon CG_4_9_14_0_2_um_filter_39_13]
MISDYLSMALRNIRKRKLRTFLTLLGILIAVATIFVLISVSLGLQNAVEEQFRLLGTDKFFIQPRGQLGAPGSGGAAELTEADLEVVEKIPGIKEISAWTAAPGKIEFKDEIRYTSVIGIDLDTSDLFIETGAYEAEEGRVLKKGDTRDVMIGSQYKHNNFLGREVKIGDTLLINSEEFEVKGILEAIGNPPDDRLIYMPEDDFRVLFNIPERIDTIVVQVDNQDDLQEIADRVEKKLQSSRDVDEDSQDFSILTPEQILESFGSILSIITGFLLGIAAISLIVGGIGIANTMYTSVVERTKEIGVMKSIGARNQDIVMIFLVESSLLGLIGGILGVALGITISKTIEYIAINQLGTTLLQAATPVYLIFGSIAFAVLAGAISGTLPAMQASKIKPTEALRYE